MDSDLAWVNSKSGRQSWCYDDAFKRSVISGAIYHFTVPHALLCLSGINETDGNEGLATLVRLVLQFLYVHADFCGINDVSFPYKSWRWASDHHLWKPSRYIRVPAALRTISHDLLLRHLNILLERYIIYAKICMSTSTSDSRLRPRTTNLFHYIHCWIHFFVRSDRNKDSVSRPRPATIP